MFSDLEDKFGAVNSDESANHKRDNLESPASVDERLWEVQDRSAHKSFEEGHECAESVELLDFFFVLLVFNPPFGHRGKTRVDGILQIVLLIRTVVLRLVDSPNLPSCEIFFGCDAGRALLQ